MDDESEAARRLIEALAAEGHHVTFGWGEVADGDRNRRVRPGEVAHFPDAASVDRLMADPGLDVVTCELMIVAAYGLRQDVIIDHHAPHPMASAPPAIAFEASSIGQLISELARRDTLPASWGPSETGWTNGRQEAGDIAFLGRGISVSRPGDRWVRVPVELVEVGAADHNLAAAVAGLCPGADFSPGSPGRARLLESKRRAFAPTMGAAEFAAAIETATQSLVGAAPVPGLPGNVADLRNLPIDGPIVAATGEQYPSKAQFLPVAAAMAGRTYMVHIRAKHGPALRMGGGTGSAGPDGCPFAAFVSDPGAFGCLGTDAPAPTNAYPAVASMATARGFAGGTLRPV